MPDYSTCIECGLPDSDLGLPRGEECECLPCDGCNERPLGCICNQLSYDEERAHDAS